MIKRILTAFCLFLVFISSAQDQSFTQPEMADAFRADGKIYVVISVIAIIFISIVFFLVTLERKLKKLENELKSKDSRN